jgi:phosphohistidine swiveling domain-containing protein
VAKGAERFTYPIAALTEDRLHEVGAKAFSLARISSLGINVPPGFVVTTGAYNLGQASEITPKLKKEILDLFDSQGLEKVAVRSSSVIRNSDAGEDSQSHSWAGIFETFLNVGRSELIQKIYECWLSTKSDAALGYMRNLGIDPADVQMAVIVQKMVDADVAGVVDSQDSENSEYIEIEAVAGLGEALVSGEVSPDQYYYHKGVDSIAAKCIAEQQRILVGTSNGVEWRDETIGSQKINDHLIQELATIAKRLENEWRTPVDIEFVIKGVEIYITQCRPITSLEDVNMPEDDYLLRLIDRNANWHPHVERPWSLFRTSAVAYNHGAGVEALRGWNILPRRTFSIEKGLGEMVYHFWETEEEDSFYAGIAGMETYRPEFFKDFARLASSTNDRAAEILDGKGHQMRSLSEALKFYGNLLFLGTVIPRAFINKGDAKKYPEFAEFCEHIREVPLHPRFAGEILTPLAKESVQDLNLPPSAIDLLTVWEVLTGSVGSYHYRKLQREQGKSFVYETFDAREVVIWQSDTSALLQHFLNEQSAEHSTVLYGSPEYHGKHEAPARLALTYNPDTVDFHPGDILVSLNGHKSLLPLIEKAGGVITQESGRLVHTARIVREMKLPFIANVKGVTRIIKSGERIQMDGSNGEIQLLR